jgi:hypothetical protein
MDLGIILLLTLVGLRSTSHALQLQAYFVESSNQPQHAPPVAAFLVSDGTWVDCVPIQGQVAAHHPSLKDHTILQSPFESSSHQPGLSSSSELQIPQLFARGHGGCPEGSIPVQRTSDPNHQPLLKKTRILASDSKAEDGSTHEYAITTLPYSPNSYSAARSILSVNGPTLGDPNLDFFSLSQVWLVDGCNGHCPSLSTIEVGWQTFPGLHPYDRALAPHVFVFWTSDDYNQTGCYNLQCPGFVQVNPRWVLGGAMQSYTTLAQNAPRESEVAIEVRYIPIQSVWWLYLNREPIGYWATSLYNGTLQGSASRVDWGGEVAFMREANTIAHSRTTMGSGAFPGDGYPRAAYHRNIQYAEPGGGRYVDAAPSDLAQNRDAEHPLCYNITVQQPAVNFTNWGTFFFFGGPGGNNPACV